MPGHFIILSSEHAMNDTKTDEKVLQEKPGHYELRLEPVVFNHTPLLGDPPQQGEVNGERQ
jgi:hypothetical protein